MEWWGVAPCVGECFGCLELDNGDGRVECSWVGKANRAGAVVGVCCRAASRDGDVDEVFSKQPGEISRSLALVLVGAFS